MPLPDDRHGPPDELFPFVHAPKTGGKTLRLFLQEMLVEHRPARRSVPRRRRLRAENSVDVARHEYWRARLDESRARIAPDRVETGVCYPP
jgi:hypothetical protein